MLETLVSPEFWIGLGVIIWVNIILSGDNAVVIALAARSLPKHQQKQAIFWGAGAAVVLRIALTIVAVKLLEFPYLKLAGGATLLMVLMERYPIIITLGAAVLGWTAGEMGVTDPAVADWVKANAHWLDWIAPVVGAVLVVVVGKALARRKEPKGEASVP